MHRYSCSRSTDSRQRHYLYMISAPTPVPGDQIGGFRLVRKLGGGDRADVYLGYGSPSVDASDGEHDEGDGVLVGAPSMVAVKIFRPDVATESISTEVEALIRADHPHAVRLLDLATTPAAVPTLIMERLTNGSLEALLDSRVDLLAGEAVTILAPVAHAVDALHAGGVVHGRIGAGTILFRDSGAPVLEGFGSARLFEPGSSVAALSDRVGVRRDRIDLARLALLILDRVGESRPGDPMGTLRQWLVAVSEGEVPDDFPRLLAARLFDVSHGEPVQFVKPPERNPAVGPRGYESVQSPAGGRPHPSAAGSGGPLPRIIEQLALPDSVGALVRSILSAIATVRKPVWIVASTIIAALVLALVFIPAPVDKAAGGSEVPASNASPRLSQPVNAHANGIELPQQNSRSPASALDAIRPLLAVRAKCLAELSVGCLAAVDQEGSPALADDVADVGALQTGRSPSRAVLMAPRPRVIDVLGDGVIVSVTPPNAKKPASLLLMKGEAGWRIRDYLNAGR